MTKPILLVALSLIFLTGCKGSTDKAAQASKPDGPKVNTEALKAQAQELNDAMIAGNYDRAIDLMYPKLVEVAGGKESLRKGLEEQMKGLPILSITVGEPRDIIEVDGETYALVPTTMNLKVPEGTLVGEAYMIGHSKDKGEHWTFVNAVAGPAGQQQRKTLFPAAADKINVPAEKPPVVQKTATPQ